MKWNSLKALAASTVLMSGMAFAGPDLGAAEQQPTNWPAIIMFLIFVGATLFITKWAAKQNHEHQGLLYRRRWYFWFPKWSCDCR